MKAGIRPYIELCVLYVGLYFCLHWSEDDIRRRDVRGLSVAGLLLHSHPTGLGSTLGRELLLSVFNVITCCFPTRSHNFRTQGYCQFHSVLFIIDVATMNRQHYDQNTSPRTATIETLDGPHQEAVRLAVSNILTTEIAETTYAQIIDGLPLIDVVRDVYGDLLCDDHPICAHTELSAGIIETARRFRAGFDPGNLRFDSTVISHSHLVTPSF